MARAVKKNDAMCPKHIFPDSVTFSMFTTEEIKKLSVLKIVSPLSFDALGHPLPTGLYDKTLGPLSEKSEPCGTCFMNIYSCPGHLGHIELPLPVINPLFDKTVVTLLKMSCLTCFSTQIPGHVKHSLAVQMKLLDKGLTTEAVEIADKVSQLISQYESFDNIPEEEFTIMKKYERLAEKATGCLLMNKNTEGLKNQVIGLLLRGMKARKTCMYCKKHLKKVQKIKDSYFIVEKKLSEKCGVVETGTKPMNREEIRRSLRSIWHNDGELILHLVPMLSDVSCDPPTDVFFFEVIPVPPPNVRPVNFVNGRITESAQSNLYKSILHDAALLRTVIHVLKNRGDSSVLQDTAKNIYNLANGKSAIEKVHNAWDSLQYNVNGVLDRDGAFAQGEMGLKQIIEKKAGIIRMHMMGKRVNFASRSVITPDPNLNIDEIGIPEEFARTLTYPVPVTMWNVEELRKRIMNGPNVYPGAVLVEFEDGSVNRINPNNPTHQESLLKRLLTPDDGNEGFRGVKMVHRHLQNGDVLLLNRQPTLHKPSIMAHTARILKGERTLRLHYANCKAYNADFDGDEMNAHFPQNEVARSEAYNLANVANQYLVPKDGTPLLGLIQDHMIAGVKLSVRGRFFTKYDYQQLVFLALGHKQSKITTLPPAIIKPEELWSGKQIISTVILNTIPQNAKPINLTSTAKIESKSWQGAPPRRWDCPFRKDDDMSEAEVVIRQGELLVGVLDKMHYGATPYGLIHCIYELYGGSSAIRLLSSFAKLFTGFLQMEGFTLGVRDILVTKDSDKKRRKITKKSRKIGKNLIAKVVDAPEESPMEEILEKLEFSFASNPNFRNIIDQQYSNALKTFTNDINRVCLSEGLICKFPENNLQLMVQSGAKGSTVNTLQISCLLGQIELEGKRPPVMISGKSLPCFPNFEFSPRAGGFIDGRFMTGIKCQEFFFHCMAGREGLIDTAVKTSRSGYLQRCLIKGLEGVTIGYDLTVRDSDNSVIQFYYGEDGMDVCKSQFLNKKQMQFLADNAKAIVDKDIIEQLKSVDKYDDLVAYYDKMKTWKGNFGDPAMKRTQSAFTVFSDIVGKKADIKGAHKMLEDCGRTRKTKYIVQLWSDADQQLKENCVAKCAHAPDPVASVYQPDCFFGSMNERLETLMESEMKSFAKKKHKRQFEEMLKLKAMKCICPPGEPVGLLAAQSIGEPSTQMTLNTFHFAGRGEMNVTLGIPRLREILMTASKTLKTPRMEIPFLDVPDLEAKAGKLIKILTRVVVADVLEKVDVTSTLDIKGTRQRKYVLRFQFLPYDLYKADYAVKPRTILKHMTKRFFGQMFNTIRKYLKANSDMVFSKDENKETARKKKNDDEDEDDNADEKTPKKSGLDEDSSDEEVEDPEDAKTNFKYNQVHDGQEPEPEETLQDNFSDDENKEIAADTAAQEDQEKESVVDSHSLAKDYNYDTEEHLWCELTFALPLNYKRVDMVEILRDVASKSVLWETPNIKRAITDTKNNRLTLITDGINMIEIFKYSSILDLNKLYSNDIHKIAETYGIEAAFRVIVKEIQDVFNVYHITVDPRHLKLVADYMTSSGIFEPFNRKGMECSASPLQQMTFESSLTFLKQAVLRAKRDQLKNPSSCLMVGKNCGTGTGSFAIMHKLFAK